MKKYLLKFDVPYLVRRDFRRTKGTFKPKFMHDPVGFSAFGGSTLVEDQGFSHPYKASFAKDWPVFSCGLPIPCCSCTVCSKSCCIFTITLTVEVPFLASHTCSFCKIKHHPRFSYAYSRKHVRMCICMMYACMYVCSTLSLFDCSTFCSKWVQRSPCHLRVIPASYDPKHALTFSLPCMHVCMYV